MAPLLSPPTRNRLLAALILAACAVSVVFPSTWQDRLRGMAQATAAPPLGLAAAGHNALRRAFDRLGALWGAADEVLRLREENRALREALARRADDEYRAETAQRDLDAFDTYRTGSLARPVAVVAANVVGADTSPWRHSLIIDRGSDDGLRIGAPAVWGTSIVGTIVALRRSAATVRLITDARSGLVVRLARTGDIGLLRGTSERDGHLQLKWIHLHPVEKGDMVITADRDPLVPPSLVVGQVVSASPTRQPLFYDVKVRPLINFDRFVELLLLIYKAEDVEELLKQEETGGK